MTGLGMLLSQLGIKIKPAEIEAEFTKLKELVPKFAANAQETFTTIDRRLTEIEQNQRLILERLESLQSDVAPAGAGASCHAR